MFYMISCKFSEFPFELCRKRAFNRAKKALFWSRAKILPSGYHAQLDSCAGPFLGVVQKWKFLEIYSPLLESKKFSHCPKMYRNRCLKDLRLKSVVSTGDVSFHPALGCCCITTLRAKKGWWGAWVMHFSHMFVEKNLTKERVLILKLTRVRSPFH